MLIVDTLASVINKAQMVVEPFMVIHRTAKLLNEARKKFASDAIKAEIQKRQRQSCK